LRHGRTIRDSDAYIQIFKNTNAIDDEVFGSLTHYRDAEPSDSLVLEWLRINPDIYTFLIHRESPQTVGYLNAIPVSDSLYERIRRGQVSDTEVSASEVLPFFGAQRIRIYVMSIAIKQKYRRFGEGLFQQAYIQLLTGFLDKLHFHAKTEGVKATHFLATAWTPEGHHICKFLGMAPVGTDRFADTIYELDLTSPEIANGQKLPKALRRLLRTYDHA
jgi:hypothetical protein